MVLIQRFYLSAYQRACTCSPERIRTVFLSRLSHEGLVLVGKVAVAQWLRNAVLEHQLLPLLAITNYFLNSTKFEKKFTLLLGGTGDCVTLRLKNVKC